jgi:hypothetical protein
MLPKKPPVFKKAGGFFVVFLVLAADCIYDSTPTWRSLQLPHPILALQKVNEHCIKRLAKASCCQNTWSNAMPSYITCETVVARAA